MQLTFENRKALVTGAGRGIGKAIAGELARQGVHVICVSQNPDSCGAAAEAILASGGSAEAHACDVGDSAAVQSLAETLLKEHGTIDILVNNAGITRDMLIMRMKDEEWDAVLRTNLNSCFYWSRALMPSMARKRWGRVINIGSVIGLMGNAGQANYAASKGGVISFSKTVAKELASRNVRCNAVAPGFIRTAMTDALDEEVQGRMKELIPLARFGEPEDVANVVLFLASDASAYVTGQVLSTCGGMVM